MQCRNPPKKMLKCMYTNLDGINNKVNEVKCIVENEKPDIVVLTETKANDSLPSNIIFDIVNFKVYRKDRMGPVGQVMWGGGW